MWRWLISPEPKIEGIAAFVDGRLAGFAHFREFPRTLDGDEAGYLDDLWVAPALRGSCVVELLFARLAAIARERRWSHVRWVTSAGNAHARRLYRKIAREMDFVTYRLDTSDRR